MKRLAWVCVVLGLAVLAPLQPVRAQESSETKSEAGAQKPKEPSEVWKWANFLLLAGGLGYLVSKHAPAFFAARSRKIVQDMTDAQKLRAEAYQAQERLYKELQQREAAELAAARAQAEASIREAKDLLAKDVAAARAGLAHDSDALAAQIADSLLRRSAA